MSFLTALGPTGISIRVLLINIAILVVYIPAALILLILPKWATSPLKVGALSVVIAIQILLLWIVYAVNEQL